MRQFRFSPALPERPTFTLGDAVIVLGIATILYAGMRLARGSISALCSIDFDHNLDATLGELHQFIR
ncbi:MAG TPA: hypothetical protein VIE89_30340 [Candidatus Binatia bacterium]|jgi:hypothetical protein